MKHLRNKRGETLVETLLAILILSLVFVFVATAAASVAKMNKKIRDTDTSFRYASDGGESISVNVRDDSGFYNVAIDAVQYDSNGYRYYEHSADGE